MADRANSKLTFGEINKLFRVMVDASIEKEIAQAGRSFSVCQLHVFVSVTTGLARKTSDVDPLAER